jgi:hypothetical protein
MDGDSAPVVLINLFEVPAGAEEEFIAGGLPGGHRPAGFRQAAAATLPAPRWPGCRAVRSTRAGAANASLGA